MRFRLQRIDEVIGIQTLYKIIVDNHCLFDEFCEQIRQEGNFQNELDTIQARFEDIANNRLLPSKKFKDITPKKEVHKEYEIKTCNLRVYLTKEKRLGKIIILGGKKNTQQKDLRKFRSIKRNYFNQI